MEIVPFGKEYVKEAQALALQRLPRLCWANCLTNHRSFGMLVDLFGEHFLCVLERGKRLSIRGAACQRAVVRKSRTERAGGNA